MRRLSLLLLGVSLCFAGEASLHAEPLPGTKPLTDDGDLSMKMVEGIDRYLMRATADSAA